MKSYQVIASRYIEKLVNVGIEPINNPDRPFLPSHLLWMLYQIHEDKLSSETKAHRWLGFVQGVLAMLGRIVVNTEREFTRDIFKGE